MTARENAIAQLLTWHFVTSGNSPTDKTRKEAELVIDGILVAARCDAPPIPDFDKVIEEIVGHAESPSTQHLAIPVALAYIGRELRQIRSGLEPTWLVHPDGRVQQIDRLIREERADIAAAKTEHGDLSPRPTPDGFADVRLDAETLDALVAFRRTRADNRRQNIDDAGPAGQVATHNLDAIVLKLGHVLDEWEKG